ELLDEPFLGDTDDNEQVTLDEKSPSEVAESNAEPEIVFAETSIDEVESEDELESPWGESESLDDDADDEEDDEDEFGELDVDSSGEDEEPFDHFWDALEKFAPEELESAQVDQPSPNGR